MTEKFPITPEGYEKLNEELHKLKTVERPAIINAIAEARSHGDLSENAEYHAAREKQGFIEAKITDLENKLARAEVISNKGMDTSQVKFGATVTIVDEETDEELVYRLVGDYEADIKKKYISVSSPVARALMGRDLGSSIEVSTPKGMKYYEIIKIEYK